MKMIKALAFLMLVTFTATEAHATSSLLLRTAQQYSNLSEHRNNRQLRKILGVNPARTPWCGYFAAAVVRKAGYKLPSNPGLAKSWTRFGKKVSKPLPGDVVVIRTRRGHHVGFYSHSKGGKIYLKGGNQSNSVKSSAYSLRNVVAYRRP